MWWAIVKAIRDRQNSEKAKQDAILAQNGGKGFQNFNGGSGGVPVEQGQNAVDSVLGAMGGSMGGGAGGATAGGAS